MHESVKMAKDRRLPLIRSCKKINSTNSARRGGPVEKIPPAPGTNQLARFVDKCPSLAGWEVRIVKGGD